DFAAKWVQSQICDLPHGWSVVYAPAVECPEPKYEFSKFERLGEVVIGAELEPGSLVVEPVGSSKHQERHAIAGRDETPGALVTRGAGNVAVEDDDLVGVDAQQLQSGVAVTGDVGRDRFQAQPIADGLGHVGLVLDDQHTHAHNGMSRLISLAYRKPHT